MWRTIQVMLGVLGFLLAFSGDKLSIPYLFYSGIACLGLACMAIGWEAMITQQIVIGMRRHGNRETYTGVPAIFQGVQFNVIGLFLIGMAIMLYLNADGRGIFLQMVRRPGLPLIALGILLLMQAAITLIGSHEIKEGQQWMVIVNLLVARLLPGVILVILGVAATGLGLFEVVAPNAFDARGGGFLETLYGLR